MFKGQRLRPSENIFYKDLGTPCALSRGLDMTERDVRKDTRRILLRQSHQLSGYQHFLVGITFDSPVTNARSAIESPAPINIAIQLSHTRVLSL